MTTTNSVTGDPIRSKVTTDAYRNNPIWDKGKNDTHIEAEVTIRDGEIKEIEVKKMVHNVESLSSRPVITRDGKGTSYTIKSPITTDRAQLALLNKIGSTIIIDDNRLTPVGFEFSLTTKNKDMPIRIDEEIGVIVEE